MSYSRTLFSDYETLAEQDGAISARTGNASAEKAAFLVNLRAPLGHERCGGMLNLETFLHGYYGELLDEVRRNVVYWRDKYRSLEKEVTIERKNSQSGSDRNKRAATKNSRSAGTRNRSNKSAKSTRRATARRSK